MLEDLKRMLGLSGQKDEELDQKLEWILDATTSRLKVLLGGIDPGNDLDYIVTEVSIIRYNRIGSEGFQSHTVEGESVGFLSSDFDAYMDDIQAYKDTKNIDVSKGGIRWA
ncbi:phage head-tail connector protein [Mordavella massiliensis]|uniref:Phage head-tail connector protein n=1 Tax=Mordavella massiliensis TaxID=1871024 RepID=A0A938XE26_9CLOT|nr:phage head-tail connector protein [Mordavella massiliensis]MBM6949347.1 phage head-tail connector protein [Mordavella massiliensis]